MVMLEDLVEEVVGEVQQSPVEVAPLVRQLEECCWSVDGMIEVDALAIEVPGLEPVLNAGEESFQTLAGFIMHHLERLPREGEKFEAGGFEFEVLDMDRQRIDKVLVRESSRSESADSSAG
jgi:putative hemolysin